MMATTDNELLKVDKEGRVAVLPEPPKEVE